MQDYVELEGTERRLRAGDRPVGPVRRQAVIQLTLHVRAQNDTLESVVRGMTARPAMRHLSREEFAATHGASPDDLARVRKFARAHGLQVVRDRVARSLGSSEQAQRTIEVRGTVGDINRAFDVKLLHYRGAGREYRGYTGAVSVPRALQGVIRNVLGLDTLPQASPRLRRREDLGGFVAEESQSYRPDQVAKLYDYPPGLTGQGQVVAILELAGGFRRRDLRKYFKRLDLPVPSVRSVSVGSGVNSPSNPNSADEEVMLDIEVLGAVAPGAELFVYFAPNTNRGFMRALNAAVHDAKNQPSVVSISWGGPECSWRAADMTSMNDILLAAAALGVTVCVAAGDGGSADDVKPGNTANADFPASSPYSLACGGTRLESQDAQTITREVVWNDGPKGGGTGGGISSFFAPPRYQSGLKVPASANPGAGPGRALPDVAGNADPDTGYELRVDSTNVVIGGTSAVAPLWAGLVARLNEGLGSPVGFLNPTLYSLAAGPKRVTRDITVGHNDLTGLVGGYAAAVGYDVCTGLGSPKGVALLNAIKSLVPPPATGPAGTS